MLPWDHASRGGKRGPRGGSETVPQTQWRLDSTPGTRPVCARPHMLPSLCQNQDWPELEMGGTSGQVMGREPSRNDRRCPQCRALITCPSPAATCGPLCRDPGLSSSALGGRSRAFVGEGARRSAGESMRTDPGRTWRKPKHQHLGSHTRGTQGAGHSAYVTDVTGGTVWLLCPQKAIDTNTGGRLRSSQPCPSTSWPVSRYVSSPGRVMLTPQHHPERHLSPCR